jgi:23S rRNA (uridine2552-2'-O)-methyltransferase
MDAKSYYGICDQILKLLEIHLYPSAILFNTMARDQRDYYYRLAKQEGYRARSAYKLLQVNEKFNIIKRGDSVVDLGAAPGGWLQVAAKLSGGKIVGVDLEGIAPIPGVKTFQADITSESTVDLVKEALGGDADVVICDAAPNLTGAWHRDHVVSVDLARSALKMAKKLLKPRGNFVVKVFQGDMFLDYLNEVRKEFSSVHAHSPPASRKESAETYVVAKKLLTSPVRRGDMLDVQIEYLGKSGDGVAMVEGFAIIVRKARQGEKLRVKIDAVKPNFAFADILERKG